MENTIVYWGNIGIMEQKMETVQGLPRISAQLMTTDACEQREETQTVGRCVVRFDEDQAANASLPIYQNFGRCQKYGSLLVMKKFTAPNI